MLYYVGAGHGQSFWLHLGVKLWWRLKHIPMGLTPNWCPLVTQLNPNTTVAVEGHGPFAKDWVEYKSALPTGHRCLGPFASTINTVTIEAVGVVYTSLLGVKSYD